MVQSNVSSRNALAFLKRVCVFSLPLVVACSGPPAEQPVEVAHQKAKECVDGMPCSPPLIDDRGPRLQRAELERRPRLDTDGFSVSASGTVAVPPPPAWTTPPEAPPTQAEQSDRDDNEVSDVVTPPPAPQDPLWTGR